MQSLRLIYDTIFRKKAANSVMQDQEYKRSCEDELDWATVEQLHEATLQISKSCFELKKLCIGLIGIALTLLTKLTPATPTENYLLVVIVICFGFWIADFTSYYYQKSTRLAMDQRIKRIASRNKISNYPSSKDSKPSWLRAAFNPSMSLYLIFMGLGFVGWIYTTCKDLIPSLKNCLAFLI